MSEGVNNGGKLLGEFFDTVSKFEKSLNELQEATHSRLSQMALQDGEEHERIRKTFFSELEILRADLDKIQKELDGCIEKARTDGRIEERMSLVTKIVLAIIGGSAVIAGSYIVKAILVMEGGGN